MTEDDMKTLAFDIAMSLSDSIFFNVKPNEKADHLAPEYLAWICQKITENAAVMSIDAMHRQLGYVQGVAIASGLTTFEKESERVADFKEKL